MPGESFLGYVGVVPDYGGVPDGVGGGFTDYDGAGHEVGFLIVGEVVALEGVGIVVSVMYFGDEAVEAFSVAAGGGDRQAVAGHVLEGVGLHGSPRAENGLLDDPEPVGCAVPSEEVVQLCGES